ncbi:MAG: PhzF family phenazine biosynthesis protein [candidate division WOR-3 bacterium]|nr:PhzF family phenazine biosynthesis protein [candidate division WOR-3 bacterium]MDH5684527.1 PhzF family phenazine biosynthesis protein [candidate division WOR-3 bacterium]
MKKECLFLDVFTDKPYSGNQLAVFPDATGLTSEQMQKLANEINYSETTFILASKDASADFEMRIFSVQLELPFAGHPTLGTAYAIMNLLDIWQKKSDKLRLKTKVGIIPLAKEDDNIWMQQNEPEFFKQYKNKKEIADLVNLLPEDISEKYPVEEVSTGNKMLIIPIKNLAAIKRANGNMNNIKAFQPKDSPVGPYLFTLETVNPSAKIHTRFFAPHIGVIEDAATGSAAGPLTGYLLKHKIFGKSFLIENEQGIEMNRPSKILLQGEIKENKYIVKIGGKAVYVGKAEFEI